MTAPMHALGDLFDVFGIFGIDLKPADADDPRRDQEPPPIPQAARDFADRHFRPRSTKRGRGKAADTIALGQAAFDVLSVKKPLTLRQLFYALVSAGAIPKTDQSYAKLKRVLRDLREDGVIPWDWLVDRTRSVFRADTWDGVAAVLRDTARLYRRDLMRDQEVAIQIWAESDSIGAVIAEVADQYTIPVFVGRGYAARGYLWDAARGAVAAYRADKLVTIFHVGDYDPSGEDIFRDVEETLRLYAVAVDWDASVNEVRKWLDLWGHTPDQYTTWLIVERLALTPEQIAEYDLPERPAKRTDPRAKGFAGSGVVEVEALVEELLPIVEEAIESCIDPRALQVVKVAEQSEREIMQRIAATPVERLVAA